MFYLLPTWLEYLFYIGAGIIIIFGVILIVVLTIFIIHLIKEDSI